MAASEMTERQRISFTLDAGLVLERLILKRLSGLKRKRGHEWLHSLLVHGFLAESQWLRTESKMSGDAAAPQTAGIPRTPFARWLEEADRLPRGAPAVTAALIPEDDGGTGQVASGEKPFTHLRKVIG